LNRFIIPKEMPNAGKHDTPPYIGELSGLWSLASAYARRRRINTVGVVRPSVAEYGWVGGPSRKRGFDHAVVQVGIANKAATPTAALDETEILKSLPQSWRRRPIRASTGMAPSAGRLLRGEPLELVARENVSIARLTEWRERALAGAATALKEREHRRPAGGGAHAGPATRCGECQNRRRSRTGLRNFFATAISPPTGAAAVGQR
jgi:hypothetical protein